MPLAPTCTGPLASNPNEPFYGVFQDHDQAGTSLPRPNESGLGKNRWWADDSLPCRLLAGSGNAFCQQAPAKPESANPPKTVTPTPETTEDTDEVLPGDWGPELLYGILSSPNEEAQFGLLRAAFAAGPAIVPELKEALKDDRTAEFAAQSLAYIGGDPVLPVLESLLNDKRDLNLRRFTYGALAEFDSPKATDILFDVIAHSDTEPDRTVTEAAIIALTVRTDTGILTRINNTEKNLQDVVIRDDLDNARMVISERAKYLATNQGKKAGGSIDSAVRTYFLPALETPTGPSAPAPSATTMKHGEKKPANLSSPAPKLTPPLVTVSVQSVTLSPDKNRALARVLFQDPTAMAYYDFVLVKQFGNWQLASVWLGPEMDKPGAATKDTDSEKDDPDAGDLH